MITPNGPNSPGHTTTANNTVDYTAITPESPNSPGHTLTADNAVYYTAITPESPNSPGHTPTADNTSGYTVFTLESPNSSGPTAELPVSLFISISLFTRDVIMSGTAIVLNYESSWQPCTAFFSVANPI